MAKDIEQQATEEVEMLARKYASEIRLLDGPTDMEAADRFINLFILNDELSRKFQIPYNSCWWKNAREQVWNIVYGTKETETDDWDGRC